MSGGSSAKSKKKRVKQGTKENLNTIITNISVIIGRRKGSIEDQTQKISDTFKNTDSYMAAIGLSIPDVDTKWYESGAKNAFAKLKRKRKATNNLLIFFAVFFALIATGGTVVAIVLIDHWAKYIIILIVAIILFFGSSKFNKLILYPILARKDKEMPEKYPKECKIIDDFITELVNMRRKL